MPWTAIQYVSSILTLVAFLAAILLALYSRRMKSRERMILAAPENERPTLVQAALESFGVDIRHLTKDQAYKIALAQIKERSKRYLLNCIVVSFISLLALIVLLVALQNPKQVVAPKSTNDVPPVTSPADKPDRPKPADKTGAHSTTEPQQSASRHAPVPAALRVSYFELANADLRELIEGKFSPELEKALGAQSFTVTNKTFDFLKEMPIYLSWEASLDQELPSVFSGTTAWRLSPSMIEHLNAAKIPAGSKKASIDKVEFWRFVVPSDLVQMAASIEVKRIAEFITKVTENHLPRGFCSIAVSYEPCSGSWSAFGNGPSTKIVIAVLENISAAPVTIGPVSVKEHARDYLRPLTDDEKVLAERKQISKVNWFPLASLKVGERLVIPLRIILTSSPPYEQRPRSLAQLRRTLQSVHAVSFNQFDASSEENKKWSWAAEIPAEHLLKYESDPVAYFKDEFVVGPSVSLVSMMVDGAELPIRKRETQNVLRSGALPATSCPFVYTRRSSSHAWVKQGHILYKKHRADLESMDVTRLEYFDGTVMIREEEPEVSYIDQVYVRQIDTGGVVSVLKTTNPLLRDIDGNRMTLHDGESVEVQFDGERCRNCAYEIAATGYYTPNTRLHK